MNIKALNPAGGETLVPSLDKVQQKYAGIMIVSAMQSSMYEHVSEDESIEAVKQWVEAGTPESVYESHIAEIMNDDCTNFHSVDSTMTEAMTSIPLTAYNEVIQTTKGQPWSKIAIQTHLFAMSLLVVILGFTLSFTQILSWIKYLLISFAFLGLWGDALSWTLAKYFAFVGYLIPFTGAMLTGTMAAMAAIILLDCWTKVPLITELKGKSNRPPLPQKISKSKQPIYNLQEPAKCQQQTY
jgi:hypothetical protein